jgi:hypothetical protein
VPLSPDDLEVNAPINSDVSRPSPNTENDPVHIDGQRVAWTNDNWRLVSRIMNMCHMSDPEGDVFLSTLRMIDFTKSLPPNVRAVRKFEAAHVGHTM